MIGSSMGWVMACAVRSSMTHLVIELGAGARDRSAGHPCDRWPAGRRGGRARRPRPDAETKRAPLRDDVPAARGRDERHASIARRKPREQRQAMPPEGGTPRVPPAALTPGGGHETLAARCDRSGRCSRPRSSSSPPAAARTPRSGARCGPPRSSAPRSRRHASATRSTSSAGSSGAAAPTPPPSSATTSAATAGRACVTCPWRSTTPRSPSIAATSTSSAATRAAAPSPACCATTPSATAGRACARCRPPAAP